MNLSKIHHIAIIVSDYEAAKDFYVNKLGFSVIRENYRPEACGLRHLAFCVDSVEQTVKELADAGIECELIRGDDYTGKQMSFFHDLDALPLELRE